VFGFEYDVTVIVPTKNEEITVEQFISWCRIGFESARLRGQIILMDSSTDKTPEIAKRLGAEVYPVKKLGLGRAYREGKEHIKGKVVIMGDADCTYDFREIGKFVEQLEKGYDLVLGNRFKGTIEQGAMPPHHQYFGSPSTSWIFKTTLGIPTGDIHCGIRALTNELYKKLPFTELGWEYASEMIVAARNLGARISEIPIEFFKEPEGRISHQKRNGWMTPFRAGWGTLRVVTTFSFDRLLIWPGLALASIAGLLNLIVSVAPLSLLARLRVGTFASESLMAATIVGSSLGTIGLLTHFTYYQNNSKWGKIGTTKTAEKLLGVASVLGIFVFITDLLIATKWLGALFANEKFTVNQRLAAISCTLTGLLSIATGLLIAVLVGNHIRKLAVS
jgi:glycosyltransferase involved in cell wall biosynthesis